MERLKADKEAAQLRDDLKRLTELKQFLSSSNNSGNRTRMTEIEEQLVRINQRLAQLDQIT